MTGPLLSFLGARGDADQWPTAGGVGGLRRATRNKKNRNKKNRKKKGSSCRHKRDTKMVGASSGSPGARWPSHSKRERESKKRNQIEEKVGRHLLPRPIDGVAKQQAATQKASCETKTREGNMQDKDGTRGSI